MRRIRRPSHTTVVAYIALFLVLTGGTAVALGGANTVQSDDLGPGAQVLAPDIGNNAVNSADITNGTVSVLDTNKVIPSGATVSGGFNEREECGGCGGVFLEFSADFHGLRAPTPLTDANINFDDIGISATVAQASEEDSGCTGTLAAPTAPPGKVCIYVHDEFVTAGSASGERLGYGTAFTEVDNRGFLVKASNSVTAAVLAGVWAYQAP